MKLLSLFDGSGGFPLAGAMCGIIPIAASEIEPYPIAVTKSRFPNMKHLGDISKINGAEIEPADIITFGSPCQDMSVAGKRAGLKHEDNGDEETTRSGLFMEAVRIIKEMRGATNGEYPRFAVWENVPGAFSSNKGEDFRLVLEELIKVTEPNAVMPEVPTKGWAYADSFSGDGWSLAYRVLDAQFWGVPQRRRRIYLVADFRGQCAGKILFKCEGLRGYFTESGTPWQGITTDAQRSVGADDSHREGEAFDGYNASVSDKAATLGVNCGFSTGRNGVVELRRGRGPNAINDNILDDQGGQQINVRNDGKVPTLRAEAHENVPCVLALAPVASTLRAGAGAPKHEQDFVGRLVLSVENYPNDSRVKIDDEGKVQALTGRMGTGGGNVPMVMEPFCKSARGKFKGDAETWVPGKVANTLNTFDTGEARANELVCMATQQGGAEIRTDGKAPTLTAAAGMSGNNQPVICLQGNSIDRADTAGCNGKGWNDESCYTLNTIDRPAVVYAIDQQGGKGGANYAENVMPTMCSDSHGTPHGVVYAVDQGGGKSQANVTEELSPTLTCTHGGEPAIALDRAFFNQGQNAQYDPQFYEDGTNPTLIAKGPSAVCTRYIVRRLTPTECARLQGFPDTWGHIEPKADFTDEEYEFWLNVRNTHAEINGKQVKDYTKKQMLTWYNKLHTDSAEYKLWGNGIALPCALYVMQGIADVYKEDYEKQR